MLSAARRRPTPPGIGIRRFIAFTMIAQILTPPLDARAALNQSGRWVGTPSLGFSSTHTVVLREPGTNASKVFMFGESGSAQKMRFWRFFPGDTTLLTPTTVGALSSLDTLVHPAGVTTDLFCSGHATLPDGKMVLVGGAWQPLSPCREVYTLDPAWLPGMPSPWAASAQMAVQRWYATATTLPDGGVLASAGTMASRMIGFGGLAAGATMDTTWRVLQPLELATRVSWGDTTAAPGDLCTTTCDPPRFQYLHQPDDYTAGRYPPGRDLHVFVGDYAGRCIAYGGRRRHANGDYEVLGDIWHLYGSRASDDTTSGWSLLEQLPDTTLPVGEDTPGPRWGSAATWAGVESRGESMLPEATGVVVCYLHGGVNAAGEVLGDLWRGERRSGPGQHYSWRWQRILAGDATTRRFGHTMMFDPGAPGALGAPRAKLVMFGGWKSRTELTDPAKLYVVGVGAQSVQPGVWRELTATGTIPPTRAWHAMTPRWRDRKDTEREYFMFGGESGAGDSSATPVAPDFWVLERPDLFPGTEDAFTWKQFVADADGPSGRSRPAIGYSIDDGSVLVVGGDTSGTAVMGGQTGAIWKVPPYYGGEYVTWQQPLRRDFHPAPPPIAGMGLVALGEGKARIARSLERFTSGASSPPGSDCGPLFGQWQTVSTPDSLSERAIADYPNLHVLPDGRLFNAGPAPTVDRSKPQSTYKRFFNLQSKQWEDPLPGAQQDTTFFGASVMYRPGRLLRAGGTSNLGHSRTQTTDVAAGAAWVQYADSVGGAPDLTRPGLLPRTHLNLTLLPTGDVLATGGVGSDNSVPGSAVKEPQIWSVASARWNNTAPLNAEKLDPDPWTRNYHSTAVLLPDARILTAGGESPSPTADQTSASIFEPPYLFLGDGSYAPRPRVMHGPDLMPYGSDFTVLLTDSTRVNTITSVVLLRPGSTTHSFDQGQRYMPLDFVVRESPKRLLVRSPGNSNLAPPGDHLLFVVDHVGAEAPNVPSVARWVRVASTSATVVDTGDVTAPRGGSYLALADNSTCPNYNADVTLGWTAPADDDTIAFTGPARAYNLRYKLNSSGEPNFNAWTAQGTDAPGPLGAPEQTVVSGLSSGTWYRFQLKAVGDNADTSGLSNSLVAKPKYCEDDGGGGSGGGEGFSARTAGLNAAQGPGHAPTENSIFPGPLATQQGSDALRLAAAPRLAGARRWVYARTGSARGLALDRARLVAVDHPSGTESAMTPEGSFVAGTRAPAVAVTDRTGRDLTASATGEAGEPVYADSGEVLSVSLGAHVEGAERYLLVETSAGDARAGISVEGMSTDGPPVGLGTVHPRRSWSTSVLPLAGAFECVLRFHGAYAVRFIGTLVQGSAPATHSAPPLSATDTRRHDWLAQAAAVDGEEAVLAPRDTLTLSFDDSAPAPEARDWYLVLDGAPLTAEAVASRAGKAPDASRDLPVAFRLHQNVPNPFARTTRIGFDLPAATSVRLEIFDLQGRVVRRVSGRWPAGRHAFEWDLRDDRGHPLPHGVYAYRLRAGGQEAQLKMVVMP